MLPDLLPRSASGFRHALFRAWVLTTFLAVCCLVPQGWSQTTHFSSAQRVLPGLPSGFGVAVDAAGDLYVADSGNNRVVKDALRRHVYAEHGAVRE